VCAFANHAVRPRAPFDLLLFFCCLRCQWMCGFSPHANKGEPPPQLWRGRVRSEQGLAVVASPGLERRRRASTRGVRCSSLREKGAACGIVRGAALLRFGSSRIDCRRFRVKIAGRRVYGCPLPDSTVLQGSQTLPSSFGAAKKRCCLD